MHTQRAIRALLWLLVCARTDGQRRSPEKPSFGGHRSVTIGGDHSLMFIPGASLAGCIPAGASLLMGHCIGLLGDALYEGRLRDRPQSRVQAGKIAVGAATPFHIRRPR